MKLQQMKVAAQRGLSFVVLILVGFLSLATSSDDCFYSLERELELEFSGDPRAIVADAEGGILTLRFEPPAEVIFPAGALPPGWEWSIYAERGEEGDNVCTTNLVFEDSGETQGLGGASDEGTASHCSLFLIRASESPTVDALEFDVLPPEDGADVLLTATLGYTASCSEENNEGPRAVSLREAAP